MPWIYVAPLDTNFLADLWRKLSCINFIPVNLSLLLVHWLYHNWKQVIKHTKLYYVIIKKRQNVCLFACPLPRIKIIMSIWDRISDRFLHLSVHDIEWQSDTDILKQSGPASKQAENHWTTKTKILSFLLWHNIILFILIF